MPSRAARPGSASDGVVLLHGLGRRASSMRSMAHALEAAGYLTLNLQYPSRFQDLGAIAARLHPKITAFAADLEGSLHIVTHSMGGLVARSYIAAYRPDRLGRVVMLGPPLGGSAVADILAPLRLFKRLFGPAGQQLTTRQAVQLRERWGTVNFELGIIAGDRALNPVTSSLILRERNDGKVSIRSTRIDGMADHLVLPVTHSFMMQNAEVIAQTIRFLRAGRFGPIGRSPDKPRR